MLYDGLAVNSVPFGFFGLFVLQLIQITYKISQFDRKEGGIN